MNNGDNNRLLVSLSADSIYRHSIVRLSIFGEMPFKAQLPGKLLMLIHGVYSDNSSQWIKSSSIEGKHNIQADLLNVITEKKVQNITSFGPEASYGMRYYPFVSSLIASKIVVDTGVISSIVIDLPDVYRLIWYKSKVAQANGQFANLDHAYNPEHSKYLFSWNEQYLSNAVNLDISIRHGSSHMLELVSFPIFYFVLALIGVAIASLPNKSGLVGAAIVAAWTFMLRKWGSSALPQRDTILTFSYIIAGAIISFWGLTWILVKYWALLGIVIVIPFVWISIYAGKTYSLEGCLPDSLAKFWSKHIASRDRHQKEVADNS